MDTLDDEQDHVLFGTPRPAPEWTAICTYGDARLEIYFARQGERGRGVQVWWTADRDSIDWRCFTCNDEAADCEHIQAAKRAREARISGAE